MKNYRDKNKKGQKFDKDLTKSLNLMKEYDDKNKNWTKSIKKLHDKNK